VAAGVLQGSSFVFTEHSDSRLATGLWTAPMAGVEAGLIHSEVALAELQPGGHVAGHYHPFEESFYILSGAVLVSIDGHAYRLETNDFGVVPMATAHAWHNVGDEPVRWFRMRSPQPRLLAGPEASYKPADLPLPDSGRDLGSLSPADRLVGRFAESHLPAPGPLSMPGYRGGNVSNISLWMLIDDLLGALHHTMFIVEFTPGATPGDHYHPFEEAYYFLAGSAIARLDGEEVSVAAGDLVVAGTNALHGFRMTADVPTRWIEVQAPAPPPSGAFIFPQDWK